MQTEKIKTEKKKFPALFWLVIVFEFVERGAYYGIMSVLSVYLTDILDFSKSDVGLIKGTIQPILYFLPIISGALADRFGYRKTLIVAFTLLGSGYFLTAQMTAYSTVFLALCLMALGAGTFKPVISGSIARLTNEQNCSLGFGIYYWSINLGAFLFPLFLVPYLKSIPSNPPWQWVIIAAALGSGLMILPTLFLFREPAGHEKKDNQQTSLMRTLADAFEIIYSPFILIFQYSQKSRTRSRMFWIIIILLTLFALINFMITENFFLFYLFLLFVGSQWILQIQPRYQAMPENQKIVTTSVFVFCIVVILWILPGLSSFARIISTVVSMTLLSLFLIECEDTPKFQDHFKFLLMIFIYSGFWVLYFQMFDSVLWYVNDYVDATSLNNAVNGLFARLGIQSNWYFDVEHVTVINAGTIILLQLLISMLVRNTKAMPTMMAGISLGILGMAILAINTNIWVFMAGIVIFSIGEMTAHPKFISYVGQVAPKDRVATYMGYIFLYGVIGSSIGAPLGANLYVHFVDNLNQPGTLWLIFSGIGLFTLLALVLYNKFLIPGRQQVR